MRTSDSRESSCSDSQGRCVHESANKKPTFEEFDEPMDFVSSLPKSSKAISSGGTNPDLKRSITLLESWNRGGELVGCVTTRCQCMYVLQRNAY